MGDSSDDSMEQASSDCREAQKKTARKLLELARTLREEQRLVNINKVLLHSSAIGGLSLAGAALAPVTGGLSLALLAVGGVMGIVTGTCDLTNQIMEFRVVDKAIYEAQAAIDQLNRKLYKLVEKLTTELEGFGIAPKEIVDMLTKGTNLAKDVYSFHQHIEEAIKIVRAVSHAQKVTLTQSGGAVLIRTAKGTMDGARANPKLAVRAAGFKESSTSAKTFGIAAAVGIGFSVKGLVEDSMKLANGVSEVAHVLETMAVRLEDC